MNPGSDSAGRLWRRLHRLLLAALLAVGSSQNSTAAETQQRSLTFTIDSDLLHGSRTIRVYLPPSYFQSSTRRYPVLYVHDGQNVFSSAGTNVAFGWGNWELDKTADALSRSGKIRELILVAIDNSPARYAEYGGTARLPQSRDPSAFENYTTFLLSVLKPRIDRDYRTRATPADTGVLGSSMGGICSFRLAWEHPDVFSRAASLSGAFQVETNLLRELERYHAAPKKVRLYFDSGVVDFMGGDDGRAATERVVVELRRIGWTDQLEHYTDAKPLTLAELKMSGLREDKWPEAQTSQHNELYWRRRVGRALEYLFPPENE